MTLVSATALLHVGALKAQEHAAIVEWFLNEVGREDLTQLIQKQNKAAAVHPSRRDVDIVNLIFETEGSCDLLVKLQKLTLR